MLKGGQKGNKGGTGRPASWFRAEMAKVLVQADAADVVKAIMAGKGSASDRLKAIQFAAETAYGKPAQPIELPSVLPVLVIRRDDSVPEAAPDQPAE